jgi:hypothetical protein
MIKKSANNKFIIFPSENEKFFKFFSPWYFFNAEYGFDFVNIEKKIWNTNIGFVVLDSDGYFHIDEFAKNKNEINMSKAYLIDPLEFPRVVWDKHVVLLKDPDYHKKYVHAYLLSLNDNSVFVGKFNISDPQNYIYQLIDDHYYDGLISNGFKRKSKIEYTFDSAITSDEIKFKMNSIGFINIKSNDDPRFVYPMTH